MLVIKIGKTTSLSCENFNILTLKKDGISFTSNKTHRIKILNAKIMQTNNNLYINSRDKLFVVSNVQDAKIFNNYLMIIHFY